MAFAAYLTDVQADALLANVVNTAAWDAASSGDKNKALYSASQAIDRLDFAGDKTDESQDNEFPRDGDTVVPSDIEWAVAYEAMALIQGMDPEFENENLAVARDRYGSVTTEYLNVPRDNINNGIMSTKAWQFLLPYLNDLRTIDMVRLN